MSQRERGLFRLLGRSSIYLRVQDLLGARGFRERLIRDWLAIEPGQRVLDIGCGPAAIVDQLPVGVEYHGFDDNPDYIAAARRRVGHRARFWQARVERATVDRLGRFDRILALGVLHHLDDDAARALFALAAGALAPGGRVITYDPCFTPGQPFLARLMAERDRGRHVRTAPAYTELARGRFTDVTGDVVTGHLRIPYTAFILTCAQPREERP